MPNASPLAADAHRARLQAAERGILDPLDPALVARKIPSATEAPHEATIARVPENDEASHRRAQRLDDRPVEAALPAPEMQRITIASPTVRHRPERDDLHAERAAHDPEPVVNVTIGRIEVRAVPRRGQTRLANDARPETHEPR